MRRDVAVGADAPWRVPPDVDELRVAIVGAGKMARLHLETLQAMPGVRVVGVAGRGGPSGQALAKLAGLPTAFDALAPMLEATRPHAAFVTVSHAATVDVTAATLEAGVPCMVEKPAGFSSEETGRLARIAATRRVPNVVGLNRRFYSIIGQALAAVLHRGPVRGVLVEAHEPIAEYRARGQFEPWLYDSWMTANSIHGIDLLRMIGGEVTDLLVHRRSLHEPRGDGFSASMQFADGAFGTFVAHWNSGGGFALRIYGDGVTAELGPLEQGFLQYRGRRVKLTPSWSDRRFRAGLYAQNATFLQAVCDGRPAVHPAADLADNVRTMRLIEQLLGATPVAAAPRPAMRAAAAVLQGDFS